MTWYLVFLESILYDTTPKSKMQSDRLGILFYTIIMLEFVFLDYLTRLKLP